MYLIAESHWLLNPAWWAAFAMVAAGLGFVIFVHELGHFLAAKWCGVKCEKFYVGFDIPMPKIGPIQIPSSICKFQWGETEYGIGILPLGGYVKMLGQDDDPRRFQEEADRVKLKQENNPESAAPSVANAVVADRAAFDPRSFPAKTVPQRMLIISAGVIMNLIFGVIFAAYAYRGGVPFTPCEVGAVVPGAPAWIAGLMPGDRIIRLGEKGPVSEYLRFDWDMIQDVNMNKDDKDLVVLVRRPNVTEPLELRVRPRSVGKGRTHRYSIGVVGASSMTLNSDPAQDESAAANAKLQGGDRIIAVDGEKVTNHAELNALLWKKAEQKITLSVERTTAANGQPGSSQAATGSQTVECEIEPVKFRRMGVLMKHGPVILVRPSSPADKAGIKIGDQIVSVDGQPFVDGYELVEQLRRKFEKEVAIVVARGSNKEQVSLKIIPDVPTTSTDLQLAVSSFAVPSLGIAVETSAEVAAVVPDSPASKELQVGDKITHFRWKSEGSSESSKDKKENARRVELEKPTEIDGDEVTWPKIEYLAHNLTSNMSVELTISRGKETLTATLRPQPTEIYLDERGLVFKPHSEIRVAQSWSEAFSLGLRQTKEDAFRVINLLRKLSSGELSPKNLGGPFSIFKVAAGEASKGLPRLLIFLTFLSANLAVMNFLPIPALDGGHMVFLFWEAIFRRPPNERIQGALTMAGVVCLLTLMVFVFGLDIWRFGPW